MAKKKTLGIRRIRQIVQDAIINPNDNPLFKYVVDENDPSYCIKRSLEILSEVNKGSRTPENLDTVLNLVAIARAQYEDRGVV